MPKPLKESTPSSSLAHILDPATTDQVLKRETPDRQPTDQTKKTPKLTGEPVDITREFHLTRRAARTLKRAVDIYGEAIGGSITNSHFLRALLVVVEDAIPHLEEEAARLSSLKRPSNAPGFEAEREAFEQEMAEAIITGLRAYGQARRPARGHTGVR
jgi:hypothetical protein